ncbi:MAG: hypothetical protein GNW80_15670 [Asgard group archaeon]|nr:hypothetical protein [Asgard group archaeon]
MSGQLTESLYNSFARFLEIAYEPLKERNLCWAIMGSLASVLQGCNLLPNDIDILVEKQEAVYFISSLFTEFFKEEKSKSPFDDSETWLSSKEQPVFKGFDQWHFQWTYAKWKINNMFIEVTLKLPPENHPTKIHSIWESGPNVWSYIKKIPFNGFQIPVIPLEIQLDTNIERGLDDRIKQILVIFEKQGYDEKLLDEVLSEKHKEKLKKFRQ